MARRNKMDNFAWYMILLGALLLVPFMWWSFLVGAQQIEREYYFPTEVTISDVRREGNNIYFTPHFEKERDLTLLDVHTFCIYSGTKVYVPAKRIKTNEAPSNSARATGAWQDEPWVIRVPPVWAYHQNIPITVGVELVYAGTTGQISRVFTAPVPKT